jgi:hypothetical protein
MDNNFDVPLDEAAQNHPSHGIHVSNDIRINLREFSLWSLVLTILGMVSLAQNLTLFFVKRSLQTSLLNTFLTVLFSALFIWLYYRMYQTSKVLSTSDEPSDLDATASAIKNFYMTLGIFMIIVMVIVLAAIFFVSMAGLGGLN